MKKTVLDVPKMYGDHHVEPVRQALRKLDGVGQIIASSAYQKVLVEHDAARVDVAAIQEALSAAGYAVGEEWDYPDTLEGKDDSSPWFKTIQRVTATSEADLVMSGDHRKY